MAMTQSQAIPAFPTRPVENLTLLELVTRLAADRDTPDAIARSAHGLIRSGRVRLTGNFRGCPIEIDEAAPESARAV
jgi:hypothetical protein